MPDGLVMTTTTKYFTYVSILRARHKLTTILMHVVSEIITVVVAI